jgi:hypothetical protein
VIGSALALAMGIVFLAAVRFSGDPQAHGLAVFVGILLVAVGCAMHLHAVLDRLLDTAATLWRAGATLLGWLAVGAGTAWLLGRAPGDEVLIALMFAPGTLGVTGRLVARDARWPALVFLALAGVLVALLGPIWWDRQPG